MTPESNDNEIEIKKNYFVRLFKGDIPLVETYWIWGVIVIGLSTRIISYFFEQNYSEIATSEFGQFYIYSTVTLIVALSIFIMIAIWRSAGKYEGSSTWKSLARLVVIGNFIMLTAGFVQGTDTDYALDQEIALINKSLPIMVDEYTRLDRVSKTDGNLYYHYSLVQVILENIDIERFVNEMTLSLKDNNCNTADLRALLEDSRSLIYQYQDKENNFVSQITISKHDCI